MKKLIAVSIAVAGIASFMAACADHTTGLPTERAPSTPLFGASTPFNNSGQCLGNDAVAWNEFVDGIDATSSPNDLTCTSNDVAVDKVVATRMSLDGVTWVDLDSSHPMSCTEGQPIWLQMNASISAAASTARFDVGLWAGINSTANAQNGSCNHYNLPTSPLPVGATSLDGDSCGDMASLSGTNIDLGVVNTVCRAGASGSLELSTCLAWTTSTDQRECPVSTVSGANGFRAGTLPGNSVECGCRSVPISVPQVNPGSITIVEDAVPNDSQDFSFATTGAGLSSFILDDDADATRSNSRTFSGLAAGAYTVAEAATPGFDLTSLSCTTGGSGNIATQTATITLAAGANVTCTFVNAKRATVIVNKRESGSLPLSQPWAFQIRTGATTSTAGTVVASGAAVQATGVVSFSCTPNPNSACENVGGVANIRPGAYQLCETNMLAGYTNNVAGFTPAGSVAEGGTSATECIDISLSAGASGVPGGAPNPINNVPPITGGSIALQTGTFLLVSNALSGSFDIRNSSMGTQQVTVNGLTIVNATFRDGGNVIQATVSGCVFAPLPVAIPAGGSQSITVSGCQVAPSVRKDLTFTVRATINGGTQPFYERTYKVRTS